MYHITSSFLGRRAIKRFKPSINKLRLLNIFIVLVMFFSSSASKAVSAAPDYPEDENSTDQEISAWWEAAGMHFPEGMFSSQIAEGNEFQSQVSNTLASSAGDPTTVWDMPIGAPRTAVTDVETDSSGNVYLTGFSYDPSSELFHAFVAKLNDAGEVQWTSPFEGADSTQGWGIFVDQSGAIYMTGSIVPPLANEEMLYARFSNAGVLQWQESYGVPSHNTQGFDLVVDDLGYIYTIGVLPTGATYADAWVAKISPVSHQIIWDVPLGGSNYDEGWDIAIDTNRNIYVTGLITLHN